MSCSKHGYTNNTLCPACDLETIRTGEPAQYISIDKAELAQLRANDARYRFIRDQDCDIGICVWDDDGSEYNDWKVLDSLHADSMIDEAMGLPAEPKRNYVGDKGICPNCSLPIYCKRCADLDDQARTILSSCTT